MMIKLASKNLYLKNIIFFFQVFHMKSKVSIMDRDSIILQNFVRNEIENIIDDLTK